MRLIGTVQHQNEAERLSSHLKKKGIENSSDPAFDAASGQVSYQIWVHDEERLEEATALFEKFRENPSSSEYDPPLVSASHEVKETPARRLRTPFTIFILFVCMLIYFLNALQEVPYNRIEPTERAFLIMPIQALFLFDLPPAFERLEEALKKYEPSEGQKTLPPAIKTELKDVETAPFWRGAYAWFLLKIKGKDTSMAEGPLFYKIRQGEVWRLFTPCLLHGSILHILFNMIWLWILGRPIEQRIGIFKTLLLTLAAGIGPNIAQYLMSGPFFLGYSGVVLGLAGFTWMRERIAPWEGYPLNRSTILFLLFFIGAMFALQFASFLMQIFTNVPFEPNIANTAHIAGALIGAFLGRFSYFAWRAK